MEVVTLTEFGRLWAEANQEFSVVARVALQGYDSGWPTAHVESAIATCNRQGADLAGLPAD